MEQLGAQLSSICGDHCIVYLKGELGAGKTTLTRGFMRALGYVGIVRSPTYGLVENYLLSEGKEVLHFDFYRVINSCELENIGIRDYFTKKAIFLIEWPERGYDFLPPADITCKITIVENERNVELIQKN